LASDRLLHEEHVVPALDSRLRGNDE